MTQWQFICVTEAHTPVALVTQHFLQVSISATAPPSVSIIAVTTKIDNSFSGIVLDQHIIQGLSNLLGWLAQLAQV